MTTTRELSKMSGDLAVCLAKHYESMEPGPARSMVAESVDSLLRAKSALNLAYRIEADPRIDVVV